MFKTGIAILFLGIIPFIPMGKSAKKSITYKHTYPVHITPTKNLDSLQCIKDSINYRYESLVTEVKTKATTLEKYNKELHEKVCALYK